MASTESSKSPIPDDFKTRTREEFLAQEKFGSLSGDDLYWILYRAATETAASPNNYDAFYNAVDALLSARLGAGNYDFFTHVEQASDWGQINLQHNGNLLRNKAVWSGLTGVLPGIGQKYGVTCLVWWN